MGSKKDAIVEISFEGWTPEGDGLMDIRKRVDFGDLVTEFTRPLELWKLPNYTRGRMKTTFERRHEWEGVITVALVGLGAFSTAFFAQLGKKTADAIWDWGKKRLSVVRAKQGRAGGDDRIRNAAALAKELRFEEIIGPGTYRRKIRITPK